MTIIDFTPSYYGAWAELFCTYFESDLGSIPEHDILLKKLCPFIFGQWEQGFVRIRLAVEGDTVIGFSIFQIDKPESDWCKRPGWGFIREFCIHKNYRHRGFGKLLALDSERLLAEMGAEQLYLTSGDAIGFWERCGYTGTEETCSNDLPILTKSTVK